MKTAATMAERKTPGTGLRVRDVLVLDPTHLEGATRRDVIVLDGRFVTISEYDGAVAAGAKFETLDGREKLLVPGLVNAHTHSPLNMLKGTGDSLNHPAFMWLNQADTAARTPDEIRLSALLGCIEHLQSGTTAVIDHFPEQGFGIEDVDAVVDAYRMSGMRALVALRIFDEPYDDIMPPGGLPASVATVNPLRPRPLAESVELVAAAIDRHQGTADGRIGICPAPSNPMRCSDDLLSAAAAIAERHDTPLHLHLLETEAQKRIAIQRYGCSMVQHLDHLGLLSRRLSCAHTIWIDGEDIALMAERGTIVVHNPASNLKIGAGIAPIARLLAAGVTVALGTDGASTNDTLDMHEAMRLAALLHRPSEPDRRKWPAARDVLAMATSAGGRALLCDGLGTLQAGAPADFVLHDLSAPAWTPLNDPLRQLVFAGSGRTVDTVVVAGCVLVRAGRIVAFDTSPVLAAARDLVRHLRARNAPLHDLAGRLIETM